MRVTMPTMGCFRAMNAITIRKFGKTIVLMVKMRHICFMFGNSPKSVETILFKFIVNSRYNNNMCSNID